MIEDEIEKDYVFKRSYLLAFLDWKWEEIREMHVGNVMWEYCHVGMQSKETKRLKNGL